MCILSEYVYIDISTRMYKYFEELGYDIPYYIDTQNRKKIKKGSLLKVKVLDLKQNSNVEIDVACDECGKKRKIKYSDYNKLTKDGKYFCDKCYTKHIDYNARLQLEVSNGSKKSLQSWIDENLTKLEILYIESLWDYELNKISMSQIPYGTNNKYYFKCPKGIHKSELKQISNLVSRKFTTLQCYQCNSFGQWGIDTFGEDFLEKYWDYEKNIKDPFTIQKGSSTKVWIKCLDKEYHKSYDISCVNFVKGNRCRFCSGGEIHPFDSFGNKFNDKLYLWSNKNNKSPFEYSKNSGRKAWFKCENGEHEDFEKIISNMIRDNFACPHCSESKGERKIRIWLEENNISFTSYKTFENLRGVNNGLLSYDFYINELNILIEYDGEFHYKPIISESKLNTQKRHDSIKSNYARHNKIKLIRIAYWNFDKIDEILSKELSTGE